MLQVSVEDLPCGWTKDNVRLAHKILLRKLTPRALENMCATTQSLAETIAVIVEETAGAEKFTLDMHMPSWHFTNSDNKISVSALDCDLREIPSHNLYVRTICPFKIHWLPVIWAAVLASKNEPYTRKNHITGLVNKPYIQSMMPNKPNNRNY